MSKADPSSPPAAPAAPAGKAHPLRLVALIGLLAGMLGLLAYDQLVAGPSFEAADASLNDLAALKTKAGVVQDGDKLKVDRQQHVTTREEVHQALGKASSATKEVPGGTWEIYRWWTGPLCRRYLVVVYNDVGQYMTHYKGEMPEPILPPLRVDLPQAPAAGQPKPKTSEGADGKPDESTSSPAQPADSEAADQ